MSTTVWNKYDPNAPSDAVNIMRPTVYANPYTHLGSRTRAQFHVSSREEAIEQFEIYFLHRLATEPEYVKAIEALRGKDLLCCCAPRPCHGHVIKCYLDQSTS